MALATSSFPVPLAPRTRTLEGKSATLRIVRRSSSRAGWAPARPRSSSMSGEDTRGEIGRLQTRLPPAVQLGDAGGEVLDLAFHLAALLARAAHLRARGLL